MIPEANLSRNSTANGRFTVMVVDDEEDIVDSLRRTFRRDYHVISATSGADAIELLRNEDVDLIITDQRMPGMTGDEVLRAASRLQPEAVRILLTGYSDLESLVKCVNEAGIYKYLTKPWEPEQLKLTVSRALEHLDVTRRLKEASGQLEEAYHDAVTMLSIACEGKDEDTGFHVQRVQHYTEAIAGQMGLSADEAHHMGVMSILHDVGKLNIPDAILQKPGPLDEAEWRIMKTHPEQGLRILGNNPFYSVAREIAGAHHENWDGSGYPGALAGEAIPLSARIVRIADVFDALSTRRPYKEPWPMDRVLAELREESGRLFEPAVVDALLQLHESGVIDEIMARFRS